MFSNFKLNKLFSKQLISPGENFFWFNLKYLFFTGMWVTEDWSTTKKNIYKLYQYALDMFAWCYVITTSIGCFQIKNDYALFIENLVKTLVGYNYLFKSFAFVHNSDKFRLLISDIKSSGDMISEKRNKLMNAFAIVATFLPLSILGSFTLKYLLKQELPAVFWLPWDINYNIYSFLMTNQLIQVCFLSLQFRAVAMQGMVCSLIIYVCDQFLELKQRMKLLKYERDNEKEMLDEFKAILKKHIRLLRYGSLLSKIFNMFFLIQNVAVILELCLNALIITSIGFGHKSIVNFLAFLFIALLNAYVYCYLGNELMIKSEEMAVTAYDLNWTSWPMSLQKDLLIMITVSQRPLCLTAAGLAPMSIQTFAQIIYNGYSIFAVLEDVVNNN